jgi:CxxC motif-containing protein (DUF1111 family)
MSRHSLAGQRRLVVYAAVAVLAVGSYWTLFSDGLPIVWGPTARAAEIEQGRDLFEHQWVANDPLAHGDGLGPVFNARSCSACHFQGGVGGGGANEHNALSFEVQPRPGDHAFHTGTVHNFSTTPADKETERKLHALFPVVKGRTTRSNDPHCPTTVTIPDFDPVTTQPVQTTALFGAGWIDLISDRAILKNARNRGLRTLRRELTGEFDNLPVGRVRTVAGGVGKFGWKGQFATLEEFVAAACANELGLGTPSVPQARPIGSTAGGDAPPDLNRKQFGALVSFVKTLPKPVEVGSEDRGREAFREVGCAICHVPDMGGVKGVYSDFLLYTLEDPHPQGGGGGGNYSEPPPQLQLPSRPDHEPKPSEWKTPPLWGVADSAPYMHDGSAPTLLAAIQKHRGDAKRVTERFEGLQPADKAALLAFLGSLKAPPSAVPLRDPSVTKLARK